MATLKFQHIAPLIFHFIFCYIMIAILYNPKEAIRFWVKLTSTIARNIFTTISGSLALLVEVELYQVEVERYQ